MNPIQFIYFDLGNVLLNFSHQRAWQQIAAVSGLTAEQVQQTIMGDENAGGDKEISTNDLQVRYETGQVNSASFHREFSQLTGTHSDCEEMLAAFSDIFELNQTIMPLLTRLLSMNFPIGILSNTCDCHWRFIVDRYPLVTECFPIRILSFEASAMKPDRRIYEVAIEQAGVAAEQIFFCDDRSENVAGALTAGMDAVLFENTLGLAADLRTRGIDVL